MLVPGRILVIDDLRTDKDKRKVVALVRSLREKGESVLFKQSMPENEDALKNVRLLIIDLFLVEGDKEASYELLTNIIRRISKETGFLIVAIWTKYTIDPERDKRIIQELKETIRYPGAVFLEPFGKDIQPKLLIEKIKASMTSKPECGLLLETERCVEKARDYAVRDIISTESIPVILGALREDIGDTALHREIIDLFLKVLSRYSKPSKELEAYIKRISELSVNVDSGKYGQIYSLQSYYKVYPDEQTWTGDILEKNGEYAVVITPACDFAQCKLDFIKIIPAIRIDHADLTNSECLNEIKAKFKIKKRRKEIPKAILAGTGLQKRFYVLKYLKDSNTGVLFHLVLDFQRVSNLPFKENAVSLEEEEGWVRVCRIDTPIIDNLLQEYSAYSSRIGIQAIPRDIIKGTIDKIEI